jgi:hypothetical protein
MKRSVVWFNSRRWNTFHHIKIYCQLIHVCGDNGVRLHCVIHCCRESGNDRADTHGDDHTSQPSTSRRDVNRTWSRWTDFDKPSSQLGSHWWNGACEWLWMQGPDFYVTEFLNCCQNGDKCISVLWNCVEKAILPWNIWATSNVVMTSLVIFMT